MFHTVLKYKKNTRELPKGECELSRGKSCPVWVEVTGMEGRE